MLTANEYVEVQNSGYYIAGTRIGLDVLTHEFRNGRSAEAIFEAYPAIGSLAKVYSALTFILEHPVEIAAYLREQEQHYEHAQAKNPLAPDMIERFERAKTSNSLK